MVAYTIAEAARELNVSSKHLLRLIEDRRLPAINVGRGARRSLRISQDAIDDFHRSSRYQPEASPPVPLPRAQKTRESGKPAHSGFLSRLAARQAKKGHAT